MKTAAAALAHLETDVLARMAAHRVARRSAGTLTAALALTVLALGSGLLTGWNQSQGTAAGGAERIVLADDARYSPAELLASN
jgi:ferric-dicitrate binding protein FerR (iron transport regulator)